jgi:hypothetical protein
MEPERYSTLTFLNADYELPARILGNLVRQIPSTVMRPGPILWGVKQNHVRRDSGYP